jgi:apolipoprotein N-acyltransferase
MTQVFEYAGRLNGFRGNLMGLPAWARFILFLVALPGIVVLSLSIAAVLCSLAALLLVTVPVYRMLRMLTHRPQPNSGWDQTVSVETPGRRHVDVRIVE